MSNESGLLMLCGQTPEALTAGFDGRRASTTCDHVVPEDGTIVAVLGHMHTLGSLFRLTLDPGEADEQVLLDTPRGASRLADELRPRRSDPRRARPAPRARVLVDPRRRSHPRPSTSCSPRGPRTRCASPPTPSSPTSRAGGARRAPRRRRPPAPAAIASPRRDEKCRPARAMRSIRLNRRARACSASSLRPSTASMPHCRTITGTSTASWWTSKS
ncbi:MAG: hypothetical protein R2711_16985 [Acidimicrobiales bacterium]